MLDLSKLEKVVIRGDKTIAACPVCRAAGGDKTGNHLFINGTDGSGKYGCVAHERDSEHRKEIFSLVGIPAKKEFTAEAKRQWAADKQEQELQAQRKQLRVSNQKQLTARIEELLASKLKPYLSNNWKADLWHSSPLNLDDPDAIPHEFIHSLYKPDDIIWMGETYDTGQSRHSANFKTCKDWLDFKSLPPRVAGGTFHVGSFNRKMSNVNSVPYLIIESDDLIGKKPCTRQERERNKALSSALISYAQDKLGLTLRAVIDT